MYFSAVIELHRPCTRQKFSSFCLLTFRMYVDLIIFDGLKRLFAVKEQFTDPGLFVRLQATCDIG